MTGRLDKALRELEDMVGWNSAESAKIEYVIKLLKEEKAHQRKAEARAHAKRPTLGDAIVFDKRLKVAGTTTGPEGPA